MKRLLSIAIVLAMLLSFAEVAPSQTATTDAGIRVVVLGLRDNDGRVGCSLYNSPDGWPRTKPFRNMWTPKKNNVAVCDFTGVPAGTYAATVLDDSNMNGKMDFNLIGLPKKGYGFTNDAKATLSPPSFNAAAFTYDGKGSLEAPIHIVYWVH